ncbi:MAG TPA: hypothetical protein PK490_09560, partial [Prosthecobacter sp.]|nr:hypothetical protein [Prosthecobacter sp.]
TTVAFSMLAARTKVAPLVVVSRRKNCDTDTPVSENWTGCPGKTSADKWCPRHNSPAPKKPALDGTRHALMMDGHG